MKNIRFVAAALAAVAVAACSSPKTTVPEGQIDPATLKPSKTLVDSASYLLGTNVGAMVKGYDLGKINFSEFTKGFNDFVNAKGSTQDPDFGEQFKIDPSQIGMVMNTFIQKSSEYATATNKLEGYKFLEANKSKPGVQVDTTTGLQYLIVEPGNENRPDTKDTVFVHYKGTTIDGTVFDETKEDAPSVHFTLNQVIKGWGDGLKLIGEGGKIKLFIPSDIAYGDQPRSEVIKGGATLLFDVTLDSLKRYVAPAEEKK